MIAENDLELELEIIRRLVSENHSIRDGIGYELIEGQPVTPINPGVGWYGQEEVTG
jgi:hypothetical protein